MKRVWGWLRGAWDLVGADLPVFSIAAFITIAASLLSAYILALPLGAGLCLMFLEKRAGRPPALSQLWEGFTRFPATITIWILYLLASIPFSTANVYLYTVTHGASWGVAVELLGHWVITVPLLFAIPLVADRDLSAREAIKLSWARVRTNLPLAFVCVLMFSLALLAGLFACGLGIIITLPVTVGALMLAYHELYEGFEVPRMTPLRPHTDAPREVDPK